MSVALIYTRKSVVRTARDEISPERQRAACMAYCETRGWRYEVYEDAEGHRSGRSEDGRPEWRRLKSQLSRSDVVAVVVNSLDRASRSPTDFFGFLDDLQRHNVELVSITEQFDTGTAIGRAFLAILMVIASLESDMASERISATIAYKKSRGQTWGNAPFGYTRDRANGMLLAPNADAPVAKAVFTAYVSERSFGRAANALNTQGLRFRNRDSQPRSFDKYAVRSVVSNVLTYAGYIAAGHAKDLPSTASTLGELVSLTDAFRGSHTPLIDDALADAALAVRSGRREFRVARLSRVFPLQAVLRCARCGGPYRGGSNHGRYVYRHIPPICVPRGGSIDALDLEARAMALLSDLTVPPALREALRQRDRVGESERETTAQVARLRGKIDRARALFIEGDITRDDYERMRDATNGDIATLSARAGLTEYDPDVILDRLNNVSEIVRNGTLIQQRTVVVTMFEALEVDATGEMVGAVPAVWLRPLLCDLRLLVPPRDVDSTTGRGLMSTVILVAER